MTDASVLVELVIVLGMAAVVTILFQALHLPVVLGYVLAGLLIGPHVPVPLVANATLVHVLSELGVILLMFTIGTELRLSALARIGIPAALTAVFEVGLVVAAGTLVAGLLGFSATESIFAGACLGISSTMLVAKAFEELGWKGGFTEVVFALLVFEDLIAIVLLATLAGVANGAGLDAKDLAILLGKLAGFLAVMLAAGIVIVPRVFRWIGSRAHTETLLISSLALCFGLAELAALAGYSVALGAFVAGVLVAESGRGHDVFELVKPFRDVFAMVFFVSVGMTIVPGDLLAEAPRIAVFSAIVLFVKPVGVAIGVFLAGHGIQPAVRAGLSLAAIGELSFVIAGIANSRSLLAIAVGVSCVTTMTSPLLLRSSERLAGWVASRLPRRIGMFVSFYDAWIGRLRTRHRPWRRFRRPVLVILLDTALVIAIVILAAIVGPRFVSGLEGDIALVAVTVAAISPLALAMFRKVVQVSRMLAAEAIPVGTPMDLGAAPRRALTVTFELGFALALAVPIATLTQPFVPASPLLVLVVGIILVFVVRRTMADFEGHVRAGSELILELLGRGLEEPLAASIAPILPGFEGLVSIEVPLASATVGRSLADLDLRARTGATVLAIARGSAGLATPSPSEPLQAGDILAVAGSVEAVAAARALVENATSE